LRSEGRVKVGDGRTYLGGGAITVTVSVAVMRVVVWLPVVHWYVSIVDVPESVASAVHMPRTWEQLSWRAPRAGTEAATVAFCVLAFRLSEAHECQFRAGKACAIDAAVKYLPARAVIAKKSILILSVSLFWSRVLIESKSGIKWNRDRGKSKVNDSPGRE
jgi:hypothetical protein